MGKNYLVFIQGTIGDSVVSMPALKELKKEAGKSVKIVVLHEKHNDHFVDPATVLQSTGLVDEFIAYQYTDDPLLKSLQIATLLAQISTRRFDRLYYLIASARDSQQRRRDRYFFRLCGIFDHRGLKDTELSSSTIQEAVLRLAIVTGRTPQDAANLLPRDKYFPIATSGISEADDFISNNWRRLRRPGGVIGIAPGSKKESSRWELTKFADLGTRLVRKYDANLVVIGGAADRDSGVALTEQWGEGANAAGRLSLSGTAALLSKCRLIIGLDTGTSHLAAAVGTSTIVIQSAQDVPKRWDPVGRVIILRSGTPCSPCRLLSCKLDKHECMRAITVEVVLNAVQQLISTPNTVCAAL